MPIQYSGANFASPREEVQFDVEELFFSRTDKRGVIAAGNDVFRRISGYDWEELVGAPHKIVRHSDMPKGVFCILWERLQKGLATGAYVKNRTKDGRSYWVYAVVSPVAQGYVSVRLKPTSQALESTRAIYARQIAREVEDGISPAESAAEIRATLRELGYPNYGAFSAYALSNEVAMRDRALARTKDSRMQSMQDLLPALEKLAVEQEYLFKSFEKIRGIPSNMRIVASRLEPAGGPISAISQNYRLMSDEVTTHLGGFRTQGGSQNLSNSVRERVFLGLFMMSASRLQREVKEVAQISMTNGAERDGFQNEVDVLAQLLEDYALESGGILMSVFDDVTRLTRSAKDLRQLVTGLDSIRVLCRVEAGRLGAGSSALLPVINQLDAFHVEIEKTLERIMHLAEEIKSLVESAMPRSYSGIQSDLFSASV